MKPLSCSEVSYVQMFTFLPSYTIWAPVSKWTLISFDTFPTNRSRKSISSWYTFISNDTIHTRKSSGSREALEKMYFMDKISKTNYFVWLFELLGSNGFNVCGFTLRNYLLWVSVKREQYNEIAHGLNKNSTTACYVISFILVRNGKKREIMGTRCWNI